MNFLRFAIKHRQTDSRYAKQNTQHTGQRPCVCPVIDQVLHHKLLNGNDQAGERYHYRQRQSSDPPLWCGTVIGYFESHIESVSTQEENTEVQRSQSMSACRNSLASVPLCSNSCYSNHTHCGSCQRRTL